MKLVIPTLEDVRAIRLWRNDCLVSLRTSYELAEEMQDHFYKETLCNRSSPDRYWSAYKGDKLIGFCGITNIQRENRIGEISLIVNPKYRNEKFGNKIVDLILDKAFNYLNLKTVEGECYFCNPAKLFWEKITKKYNGYYTILSNRKFWEGHYHNSYYFSIDEASFNRIYNKFEKPD